jgi:predicted RNase H-like nuclease (RuvC/YqgF family)
MVHKSSNGVLTTELDTPNTCPANHGIHKYGSTSSWLDEYDSEVDKMNRMLDREYEESARRLEEAEARIEQLQDEEEYDRQMDEENAYREEMRQLEMEKAKAEVEAVKEQIKRLKAPTPRPTPQAVVEQQKPSLKSKLKTVAGIVGTAVGHPEVGVIASVLPEGNGGTTTTKTVYKQPEYTPEGELVYGSWAE